jgi:hypothetical protein
MMDRNHAIELARQCAAASGWALQKPLHVVERTRWWGGVDRYEISSNPALRGNNARFVIDAATSEIRSKGYVPR